MNIQAAKSVIVRSTSRGMLLFKKNSPTIFMVIGVGGLVTSTVMACSATLKADAVIEEANENLAKIKKARELADEEHYSKRDHTKDLTVAYVQAGKGFLKLYWPAVTVGVASIGFIVGGHNIMHKRNLAMVAAYKAIETGFMDYRRRVVEEYGLGKDLMLKNGISKVNVTLKPYTDEEGEEHEAVDKMVEVIAPLDHSQYARFFDEGSSQWSKTPEYNFTYLKCQQNFANDLLKTRGHVFLNEVYDMLGIPRSQAGSVVGWVDGEGDSFIDFGIFNGQSMSARDFVNGYERSILLDFNVDGLIYDKI